MAGVLRSGSRSRQPAKAHRERTAVEAPVGSLHRVVGHVEVTVLNHQGTLRPEKVLKAEPGLRVELGVTVQFGNSITEGRIQDAGPHIDERDSPSPRPSVQAEEQCVTGQSPARVNRVAQQAFVHNFQAAQGYPSPLEISYDNPQLWLRVQQVDVRRPEGIGALEGVADLESPIETAAGGPELVAAGRRF